MDQWHGIGLGQVGADRIKAASCGMENTALYWLAGIPPLQLALGSQWRSKKEAVMDQENPGRTAALELSFAFMGLLKVMGLETRLFRRWGMSPRAMRRIGLVELSGAFLVANEGTRPIAAAGLAAVSSMLLAVELRNHEAELVLPRLAVTLLALRTAAAGGAKLRDRIAA